MLEEFGSRWGVLNKLFLAASALLILPGDVPGHFGTSSGCFGAASGSADRDPLCKKSMELPCPS